MITPAVHLVFPLWESLWDHLGKIIDDLLGSLADRPEEPPLGIKFWWEWRHGLLVIGD